jgi:hypothetical protein
LIEPGRVRISSPCADARFEKGVKERERTGLLRMQRL